MTEGGTYTLLATLPAPATLTVGALGDREFPAGAYAYTGSALGAGGFSRVDRHRRVADGEHDVRHWHVDYLLGHPATRLRSVVRSAGVDVECPVAERLPDGPVGGFGASDCGCRSHLAAVTVEGKGTADASDGVGAAGGGSGSTTAALARLRDEVERAHELASPAARTK